MSFYHANDISRDRIWWDYFHFPEVGSYNIPMIFFHEMFIPSLFLARVFFSERNHSKLSHTGFVSTENQAKSEFFQPRTSRTFYELSNETSERPFTVPLPADRSGRVGCLLRGSGWSDVVFFGVVGWWIEKSLTHGIPNRLLIGSNSKVVSFIYVFYFYARKNNIVLGLGLFLGIILPGFWGLPKPWTENPLRKINIINQLIMVVLMLFHELLVD